MCVYVCMCVYTLNPTPWNLNPNHSYLYIYVYSPRMGGRNVGGGDLEGQERGGDQVLFTQTSKKLLKPLKRLSTANCARFTLDGNRAPLQTWVVQNSMSLKYDDWWAFNMMKKGGTSRGRSAAGTKSSSASPSPQCTTCGGWRFLMSEAPLYPPRQTKSSSPSPQWTICTLRGFEWKTREAFDRKMR